MTIDLEALAATFPTDEIHWRVGSTNKKKFDYNESLPEKD